MNNQGSWDAIKWLAGGAVGLVFALAILTQYQTSTSRKTGRTNIVRAGQEMKHETSLSNEESFASGMAMSKSGDAAARAQAITIVMSTNLERGAPVAQQLLSDPDPSVRIAAIAALTSYGIKGSGVSFAAMLNDPDPNVRSAAGSSIGRFASEPGIAYQLTGPLASRDASIAGPALEAWKSILPNDRRTSIQAILPTLSSGDDAVLMQILSALAVLTKDELKQAAPALEGVRSRMSGQPSAAAAERLIAMANG